MPWPHVNVCIPTLSQRFLFVEFVNTKTNGMIFNFNTISVSRVRIAQHAIYQTICPLESIPFIAIQVHRTHRAVPVVHLGQDLSKKAYLVSILVQDLYAQYHQERTQTSQRIGYDLTLLIVIHRTIPKHAKGFVYNLLLLSAFHN